MIEEVKGFFTKLADKADEALNSNKEKTETAQGFEALAVRYQSIETPFLIAKSFYGIYNPKRQQMRFRIEDQVSEREIYKNSDDTKDENKYIIKKIVKENVRDFIIRKNDKSIAIPCYLAEIEIL